MMAQTLTWQGAYVLAELGIAGARTKFEGGRLTDEATATAIGSLTRVVLAVPEMSSSDIVALATDVVGSLGLDVTHVTPPA
jgi:hypothetical protein